MPEKNMKLNTPTVGIGIRGTELLIDVYEDGSTEVSTISGAANVVSAITNEVLDVLAGQSVLADAEGVFIGGVRDFIHKSADDAIQREINKLRSKSPIPLLNAANLLVVGALAGVFLLTLKGEAHPMCLGLYPYQKVLSPDRAIPCIVSVYAVQVIRLRARFPERKERNRKWYAPQKAAGKVEEPALSDILAGFTPQGPAEQPG
jgi:hypothetical protein